LGSLSYVSKPDYCEVNGDSRVVIVDRNRKSRNGRSFHNAVFRIVVFVFVEQSNIGMVVRHIGQLKNQ
jgi:hypothetical protein